MTTFTLRRGVPCHVRKVGETDWRPHVSSENTVFTWANKRPLETFPFWVFAGEDWEVRVRVQLLERGETDGDEKPWRVGAAATREGLSDEQKAAVFEHFRQWMIYALSPPELHHGGEAHGDRDIHRAYRKVYGTAGRVVIYPASDQPPHLCDWSDADHVCEAAPSLQRNKDIVAAITEGSVLIACPRLKAQELRSGTWATVRAAERSRKGVLFFHREK